MAQGDSDTLVHPTTTTKYVDHLCATAERVRYRRYEHIGHGLVALRALPLVQQFFGAALDGKPMSSTCS